DRLSCTTSARDLFLNDWNDACHRRTAIESAAFVDEVFDHVDDDERSFHQWPGAGSHNSMRCPSGSVIHAKRPLSSSYRSSETATPSARSFASNPSRSSARELIMN